MRPEFAAGQRYYDLNTYFQSQFGQRVHKIVVDAGFTCPNRDGTVGRGGCIYCNSRGSGTGAHSRGLSVKAQLEDSIPYVARRFKAQKFIAYFQSFSNTYAPVETLRRLYEEALAVRDVVGLSIGTRPDCIDEPKLELLQSLAKDRLVWVEYGLQSGNDATLRRIHRGHDVGCFLRAVRATQNRGIRICAHAILGLPGEGRHEMMRTARVIADSRIDGVKLHLLYVIRGTPLERMYREGSFRCLERTEYAERVVEFLERIPPEMVVQRLTADPHRNELVAPAWALEKNLALKAIRNTLEAFDTWQGKHWCPHRIDQTQNA